jgi:hypothetical protein
MMDGLAAATCIGSWTRRPRDKVMSQNVVVAAAIRVCRCALAIWMYNPWFQVLFLWVQVLF